MTSTIKDLEDAAATLDRAWRDMEYAHRAPYRVAANQDVNDQCQLVGGVCDELAGVIFRFFARVNALLNDERGDSDEQGDVFWRARQLGDAAIPA